MTLLTAASVARAVAGGTPTMRTPKSVWLEGADNDALNAMIAPSTEKHTPRAFAYTVRF
jgi:hypothetical protein